MKNDIPIINKRVAQQKAASQRAFHQTLHEMSQIGKGTKTN
jgi:hypothetical protein